MLPPRHASGDLLVIAVFALAVCTLPAHAALSAWLACRDYSARDEARCDCDKLQQVLDSLPGAQRMVVSAGHSTLDHKASHT